MSNLVAGITGIIDQDLFKDVPKLCLVHENRLMNTQWRWRTNASPKYHRIQNTVTIRHNS